MADTKNPTPAAKTAETKAQKFSRLAIPRIDKALKTIRLIGNLAGPGYESTPEQRAKIESALKTAVAETMARFAPGAAKSDGGFSF